MAKRADIEKSPSICSCINNTNRKGNATKKLNASKCAGTGSNYHLKMICFIWTKGNVESNVMET